VLVPAIVSRPADKSSPFLWREEVGLLGEGIDGIPKDEPIARPDVGCLLFGAKQTWYLDVQRSESDPTQTFGRFSCKDWTCQRQRQRYLVNTNRSTSSTTGSLMGARAA
jgi:hypothetical protein